MTRRLGGALIVAALIASLALPAFGSTRTYADDFSSGGYGGSTGSANWDTSWSEVGENDGPSSGSVTVDSGSLCDKGDCLVIEALLGGSYGAWRRIDMTGSSSATLSYYVDFPQNLLGGSSLVEARADGGGWTTLSSHSKGTKGSFQRNLPAATASLDIRFTASGLAVGTEMGFDSIMVSVEVPITTTTTTTSTSTTSTTASTTTTTRPIVTVPTTVTLPPILTTTTSTTTPGDRPPDDQTTTTTTGPSTTSTTRSGDSGTTTTTTDRGQSSTTTTTRRTATTGTSTPPAAPPGEDAPEPPPPPPSETFGVVTRLDPGVILSSDLDLTAQDRLIVRFVRASEKISFDILLNLALGIILAWASLSTMQRKSG